MADYNSVPLGQAGTGAAFLLGPSRALSNWMAQDKQNAQVRRQNTLNQQEFDQNLSNSYATNKFKGVPGLMWNAELQGKIDEHTKQGAEYLAKGIDIYNPNFRDKDQVAAYQTYQQDRAMLNNMLNAQKQFQQDADAQQKLAKGDPYAFTPESISSVSDFESGNTLQDIVSKGTKFPTLEKVFDYNKNVTEQIPVLATQDERIVGGNRIMEKKANVPAIEGFVNNLLVSGPNRNWVEKQIGGSVDGLLRTTNKQKVKQALDAEFRSPTGLDLMVELKNAGKVPSYGSAEYEQFLEDATKEQLRAETKFDEIASKAVQDGIAKANPSYKKIPDYSLVRERDRREGVRQRNVKFNERGDEVDSMTAQAIVIPFGKEGKDSVELPEYVPISISKKNFAGSPTIDMRTGKPGPKLSSSNDYEVVGVGNAPIISGSVKTSTGDDLNGSIAQPNFAQKNPGSIESKPIIHVQVPGKDGGRMKDYFIPFDRLPENVKKSKPIAEALSKFTPATKSTAKAQSAPKTTTMSKIKGLVGKPGYEGYSEKELADYYRSQGYTVK